MEFREFKAMIQEQAKLMEKDSTQLFLTECEDTEVLWNIYLESIPSKYNQVFREKRSHDCSCCRHFIKSIANLVAIKDNKVVSLWDFEIDDKEYAPSVKALSKYIHDNVIKDVFITKDNSIGTDSNKELFDNGEIHVWEHHYLKIPREYVTNSSKTLDTLKAEYRERKFALEKSLNTLTQDALETALELINSNDLYKGNEWESRFKVLLEMKREYDLLEESDKINYIWKNALKVSFSMNSSIGTLLENISNGMELSVAIGKYRKIVDPANYQVPLNLVATKKELEMQKKHLEDLGYTSMDRRYANSDDININDIMFINKDIKSKAQSSNVFDLLETEVPIDIEKLKNIEEMSIEDFLKNIVPNSSNIEALVSKDNCVNMVSLITQVDKDAKAITKWDNGFTWSYKGNMTDSSMKERVEKAGGDVKGDFRASLQWNNHDVWDKSDLDLHCLEPNNYEIYFPNERVLSPNKGMLDIDVRFPKKDIVSVENIIYKDRSKMKDGTYTVSVLCFDKDTRTREGFEAEIELNGQIYFFNYEKNITDRQTVKIAEITLKDGEFTLKEFIPYTLGSNVGKKVWGVTTNTFTPVSMIMNSPNYWDKENGIGNKHYFFMLRDCINNETPNGFYNEFLKKELVSSKKVMALIGNTLKVADSNNQLSGIGFSDTIRKELVVRVQNKRIIKIKF